MRRILSVLISIILLGSLPACSGLIGNTALKTPVYPDSIKFENYEAMQKVREANPIEDSFLESQREFSIQSAARILSGQSQNTCYSPISLYMALALASSGAEGITQDEIFSILKISGKDVDYLSDQAGNLFRQLYLDNEIGKLKIANSLWMDQGIAFHKPFIDNAAKNFYASIYHVDFNDNKTAQLMSKWISDNTNGILKPEIAIGREQILSILNTIYFKDEWIDRFDKEKTKPDTFYLEDGSEVECDFMNRTYSVHSYVKGNGFTSSSLGLKNVGSMTFVLPDKGVHLADLLADPETICSMLGNENNESGKVIFQVPKFSYGSDLNLKDMLESMGMTSAFQRDADFTGITDGTAFLTDVRQQTHIAIDEKGVEAAAFTQIDYAGSAAPKEQVAEMILDRPFIYIITGRNNTILFIGIVNNPKQ